MFEHASLALFECLMGKLRFILHFDLEAQAKQRDDCNCLDLRKSKTTGLLRDRSKADRKCWYRRPMHDRAPPLNGMNASRGQSGLRKREGLNSSGFSQYLAMTMPLDMSISLHFAISAEHIRLLCRPGK